MRIVITIILFLSATAINNALYGQTVSLPDTNFINHLKYEHPGVIDANNNLIPDEADNITHIHAPYNNISSLEGIQHFDSLSYLNVSGNNIDSLPDLSNNTELTKIYCNGNDLSRLPDLSALSKLKKLKAGNNNISVTPDLSANHQLEKIELSNNNLTNGPALSHLNNLNKVDLSNNFLTFEELLPYQSHPGYNFIFNVSPQKKIPVGDPVTVRVSDSITLVTGIDTNLTDITYTWYKDGDSIYSSNRDTLVIDTALPKHEGTYYVEIEHDSFLFALQTTDYNVSVRTCLDSSAIEVDKTPFNCLHHGNIKATYTKETTGEITYKLHDLNNNETYKNTSGEFNKIPSSRYELTLINNYQCSVNYPSEIRIGSKSCKEVYITPDEDNNKDEYHFKGNGKAEIYNKAGKMVRSLSLPDSWEGKDNHGKLVSPGYYVAKVNDGEEFIMISVIY